jgi:hypothetical protein
LSSGIALSWRCGRGAGDRGRCPGRGVAAERAYLGPAWLSEIKGFDGTRPRTLTLYKGLAERYVKPVIGGVRLDKLTPAHVQRLVTETRNTRASRGTPPNASTLRHVYKLVRNALRPPQTMPSGTQRARLVWSDPSRERYGHLAAGCGLPGTWSLDR